VHRAYQVSFDRPYSASTERGPFEFLNWEYQMVRYLERNGYNVAYSTDVDTDLAPALLLQHRAFLSVGHDEYWSRAMRATVEAALAQGVNLAFFGGNDVYWNVRYAPSPLGPDRVITCHKDATLDPLTGIDNSNVTVQWRQQPLNRPENALLGAMYSDHVLPRQGFPLVVTNPTAWPFSGVDVTATTALPNVVGNEYDRVFNNGVTPPNLTILAQSPVTDTSGRPDLAETTIYTASLGRAEIGYAVA
jgi:hypothetical protein